MDLGLFRAPVGHGDLDQDVLRRGLGVFHEDVKVAVLVEDAGIQELIFPLQAAALAVCLHDIGIRVGCLGVLIEIFMEE